MNDKLIFCDGTTLYITLESKIKSWVKWILIVLNILLYAIALFLFSMTFIEKDPSYLFAFLTFSGAVFWFVTRSTLWNIFGRESLVITTENLSFQNDYGWYKTKREVKAIEKGLIVFTNRQFAYEDDPYVSVSFFEILNEDEAKEIYSTGIKTDERNFKLIHDGLNELFDRPYTPHDWFSMN